MKMRKYHDMNWLYEQYITKGRTTSDISEECGVSPSRIWKTLIRFNIKTRKTSDYARVISKEFLIKEFTVNKRSARSIAADLKISHTSILARLYSYGLLAKKKKKYPVPIEKKWLQREYIDMKRSANDIAKQIGVSQPYVVKYLELYGIEKYEPYKNKDWLIENYANQNRKCAEIAKEFGVTDSTVLHYLRKYNITTNDRMKSYSKIPSKKWLSKEFMTRGTEDIGRELGVTSTTVLKWLCRYNIKSNEELRRGKIRSTFKNTPKSKKSEWNRNRHQTKKRLGTYGKSKIEDRCFEFIKNNVDSSVERQILFGSYSIDFYLPKYNLYVEFWGDYFHGLLNTKKQLRETKHGVSILRTMKIDKWKIANIPNLVIIKESDFKKDHACVVKKISAFTEI